MSGWTELITQIGVMGTLVVFFVWTGWQREKILGGRIDDVNKRLSETQQFQTDSLITILRETHVCIAANTHALTELIQTLGQKPCLLEDQGALERLEHRLTEVVSEATRGGQP